MTRVSDIIKEIEKNKVLLHCSCPCEFYCKHIYAALKAIQNGEEKKFYKVMMKYGIPQQMVKKLNLVHHIQILQQLMM